MTTDEVVVDVSQDWMLACDVQQGFMQGAGTANDFVDFSAPLPSGSSPRRRLL